MLAWAFIRGIHVYMQYVTKTRALTLMLLHNWKYPQNICGFVEEKNRDICSTIYSKYFVNHKKKM